MSITESACQSASAAGLRVEDLPFARVPNQSRLFLEYLRDPISLRRFYPSAVGNPQELAARARTVLDAPHADRDALCDALAASNKLWGAGAQTLAEIARLRRAETLAVVTGQQVGLFTGPLYTVYKALSAVKLARCLTQRGTEAVAVFWMATEDHDWPEVRVAEFTDREGRLARVSLPASLHRDGAHVGGVALTPDIEETTGSLLEQLPANEFTGDLQSLLRDTYATGRTHGEAFARMLTALTKDYGLILLDPLDATLKQLAAPLYAEAARRAPELAAALEARSRALVAEGFHAQVFTSEDAFPLFYDDDSGARRPLARTAEGTYKTKGAKPERTHTPEEWAALALGEPQRFSPNVTLRAVVQDYLLPTVAYFGGAAEIAYFAQIAEAYRLLARPATTILHRASLTLVERPSGRTLERYKLNLPDFFEGLEAVAARVVEQHLGAETARAFDRTDAGIADALAELQQHLRGFDPTLADALDKGQRKIRHQLEGLRTRFHRAQLARDSTAQRQLERAAASLYPGKSLQERHLNITSLLARHGRYVVEWMYGAIDLNCVEHRVVYL
ncbi:MAG TPA: bacillithiol biosynthesis cysteine-adding enzyme BshC [Pyrinomonadaceae bacterium]|nr:bacillithiol biosynthesis cysteine-adding enzyme BshC [Pyrinomonadaceae bacterium]